MTVSEWVKTSTTLFAIDRKQYQCVPCLSKYSSRKDAEEMTERARSANACRTARSEPFLDIDKEIFFSKCPGNFTFSEVVNWFEAHSLFHKGTLPFPGSLMDQPNKVIELFQLFDRHAMLKANEERKRVESMKKGSSRG